MVVWFADGEFCMPSKKGKRNKDTGGNKRKNISPITSDDTCTRTEDNVKTGSKCKHCTARHLDTSQSESKDVSTSNKRFHPSTPDYYSTSPQFCSFSTPNMSLPPQQQQFSGSYIQSPPGQYKPQYMTIGSAQPQPPPPSTQIPPQWANSIMDDVKSIKGSVSKIDSIEKTVNSICSKLSDLETKVKDMDTRIIEVERACTFMSEKHDTNNQDLQGVKGDVKKVKDSCISLAEDVNKMEQDFERLNSKVLDQEFRSMRDNLIFYGIRGSGPGQNIDAEQEKCDLLVKELIESKLDIDATNITLDRAHRLGNRVIPNKPRPIIAKFHYYNDREQVRTAAFRLKDDLKRENFGVGIQLPKEWREARKQLYPAMQAERNKGNNTKFIGEKLYVNRQPYKPKN